MALQNSRAYRIDHIDSIQAIEYTVNHATVSRTVKLAYLYGARHVLYHGGVPEMELQRLDELIVWYERNRDSLTGQAEKVRDDAEKNEDSGSRC